jgi:hypothetical protein
MTCTGRREVTFPPPTDPPPESHQRRIKEHREDSWNRLSTKEIVNKLRPPQPATEVQPPDPSIRIPKSAFVDGLSTSPVVS